MSLPTFEYWYWGTVLNVVDGDTVDIELDLGFRLYWKQRFRLYGINTCEMNDTDPVKREKAQEAKQFVIGHTAGKLHVNTHMDKADKYGRWLAIIHAPDGDGWLNINTKLVELGLAVSYMAI